MGARERNGNSVDPHSSIHILDQGHPSHSLTPGLITRLAKEKLQANPSGFRAGVSFSGFVQISPFIPLPFPFKGWHLASGARVTRIGDEEALLEGIVESPTLLGRRASKSFEVVVGNGENGLVVVRGEVPLPDSIINHLLTSGMERVINSVNKDIDLQERPAQRRGEKSDMVAVSNLKVEPTVDAFSAWLQSHSQPKQQAA